MSDQTALSFASKTAPADGVVVVFAEEGAKLTPSARDLDKKSKGLLSRAIEITGFNGKKEQTADLLAPQGLKFPRQFQHVHSWDRLQVSSDAREIFAHSAFRKALGSTAGSFSSKRIKRRRRCSGWRCRFRKLGPGTRR